MATYYLILMIIPAHSGSAGASITTVEMYSKNGCEIAGKAFLNKGSGNYQPDYICVKK